MDKDFLLKKWDFRWPLMDVLIGGTSSIDMDTLWVRDAADAAIFIKSYGYDLDDPLEAQKMDRLFVEALFFIQSQLMPKQWLDGNRPPADLLICADMRQLLLWASNDEVALKNHQMWACAILKVMHTISHIDGAAIFLDIEKAKEQIIGRFEKSLSRDEKGQLWFGAGELKIIVEKVEWKLSKSRSSIILKLLHKPANVAETIYDLVGVRIVTKTLSEVLLAIRLLSDDYLVDFPNTHPTRARNNLIDIHRFRVDLETFRLLLQAEEMGPESFQVFMDQLCAPPLDREPGNPHSSQKYHSIQLTCRQRIYGQDRNENCRRQLARLEETATLNSQAKDLLLELKQLIKAEKEWIFFPFEVQITDKASDQLVESGEGSHLNYKRQQIRTARRRILAKILVLDS